jgi:hypothetical protein
VSGRPAPHVAAYLLDRCLHDNEALAGDVLEEFEFRRSRVWLWRQVLVAIGYAMFRQRDPSRPLKLSTGPLVSERTISTGQGRRVVNLTASPLPGAGGLSVAALVLLMTVLVPDVWWILLAAAATGAAFGIATALLRTRYSRPHPNREPGRTLIKSSESTGGTLN